MGFLFLKQVMLISMESPLAVIMGGRKVSSFAYLLMKNQVELFSEAIGRFCEIVLMKKLIFLVYKELKLSVLTLNISGAFYDSSFSKKLMFCFFILADDAKKKLGTFLVSSFYHRLM